MYSTQDFGTTQQGEIVISAYNELLQEKVAGDEFCWGFYLRIENNSQEEKELSLFSVFSFEDFSFMGSYCKYDEENNYIYKYAFPTHALYDDKKKLDDKLKYVYLYCDQNINSFETNKYRFYGCEDETEIPLEVKEGKCHNTITQGMESIIGAVENKFVIGKNERYTVNFIMGVTPHKNEIKKRDRHKY